VGNTGVFQVLKVLLLCTSTSYGTLCKVHEHWNSFLMQIRNHYIQNTTDVIFLISYIILKLTLGQFKGYVL